MTTDWDYCAGRAAHYADIASDPDFPLSDFLEPLFQRLPFKLGSSSASTVIPYAFDDQFVEDLFAGTERLARLVRRRKDGLLANPSTGIPAQVQGEPNLGAPHHAPKAHDDQYANMAIRVAMCSDPLLDAGLMGVWLSSAGGGVLLNDLVQIFAKAFAEDMGSQARTSFLHVAWTAFINASESAKECAKPYVSRTISWEKLEKATGLGLFSLARSAIEPILQALATRRFSFDASSYRRCLLAAVNPLTFLSIPRNALQDDLGPWSPVKGVADDLERIWFGLLEGAPSPLVAARGLFPELSGHGELLDKVRQSGAVARLRQATMRWLLANRDADDFIRLPMERGVASDAELFRTLNSPRGLDALMKRYQETRHLSPEADQACKALTEVLKDGFGGEGLPGAISDAFICWAMDRAVAHSMLGVRKCLRDQRGAGVTSDDLKDSWLKGRLYRFAADRSPTLCALAVREQGHLFIDLKGFTQRTYRAKEIIMADFLRTEFYEPILSAAARCGGADKGVSRIQLQNLPGDAVVFSGDITSLMQLAQEIWRICRTYGEKLQKRLSQGANGLQARRQEADKQLKERIAELERELAPIAQRMAATHALPDAEKERLVAENFRKRAEALDARLGARNGKEDAEALAFALKAKKSLERQELAARQKLGSLAGAARAEFAESLLNAADSQQQSQVRRQMDEARETARIRLEAIEAEERDMSLDAGLFITFGAAAEIATMQSAAFGKIQVAIAEKINEASRGTGRSAHVKARIDELTERERAARGNQALTCPFRVLLAPDFCLSMTPTLSTAMEKALAAKDPGGARSAAQAVGQLVLMELARAMGMGDGRMPSLLNVHNELYNVGEAVSGEALDAWLKATSATRQWFRKVVPLDELDVDIRARFFFPTQELELVASIPFGGKPSDALVFRKAGQVQFRGFEAKPPTVVYELLRRDEPLFQLLAKHHLSIWLAEADAGFHGK